MESKKCWFCENETPDPDATVFVKIQGDELGRKKTGYKEYKIIFEGGAMGVPRCSKCKEIHESTKKRGLGCTFSFIIPVLLGIVFQQIFNPGSGSGSSVVPVFVFIGVICGIIISVIIGKRFIDFLKANETKPENQKTQYPPIKALIDKGYKIVS